MGKENGAAWVCDVCGYVHRGPEPPETCPICGAGRESFESYSEPAKTAERDAPERFRCLICGYVHEGTEPPAKCPVCGASADDFEPFEGPPAPESSTGAARKVVIAGAGVAGVSAAEALRDASPDAETALISKERALPYYRLNLTRYLAGEVGEEALPIHPEGWYDEKGIRLLRGLEAKRISPDQHAVELSDGSKEPFDRLVITCGAHPFVPPIPGAAREGVTTLRTLADANALLDAVKPGVHCLCIGGGILGLETAGGLAKRGARVTVLEGYDWLLPRQLNREAGQMLERHVAGLGIEVRCGVKIAEIAGKERASGLVLADGTQLGGELVVVTAGVRSNSHLARAAGLEVNQGIVVDSHLTSSHPDILAAGDVAEHQGTVYGLWEPARYQGVIAGMNAAGLNVEFGGLPRTNTLKVLDIQLFSIGMIEPQDGSYDVVSEAVDGKYYRFLLHDGRLVGAILLGDTRLAAAATKAVKDRTDLSKVCHKRASAADVLACLQEANA